MSGAWAPLLLLVLCVTDGAFCGYRAAAGRDAHIFKADLYRRAVRRGMRYGLGLCAAVAAVAALTVFLAPDRLARYGELRDSAADMADVLLPYAVLTLAMVGIWAAAEADARTLASVVVLGPLTLVRPFVIAGAGGYALWHAHGSAVLAVTALATVGQLLLEPALE